MKRLALILLALVVVGCNSAQDKADADRDALIDRYKEKQAMKPYSVVYKVEGEEPVEISLTYANKTGATSQTKDYTPWEYSFKSPGPQSLYLSAQAGEWNEKGITVSVYVDGKLIQQASATEPFGIATASGSI